MRRTPLDSPAVRICSASFFQMVGFQASYFVGLIGCATYQLGAGAWEVSMLVLAINVLLVVGSFCGGSAVDAVGPRRTLTAGLATMAATGLAGWLVPPSFSFLMVEAGLLGLLFGVCTTAFDAYPRFMTVDAADLQRMNSLNAVSHNLTVVVGPALGGLVALLFSNQSVFAIPALSSLPALALVRATPESGDAMGDGVEASRPNVLLDAWRGLRVTFGDNVLRFLFVLSFLGFFCYGAFDSLESLFYRDYLRVGSEWMGWLSACMGVGGFLGSLVMLRMPSKRLTMRLLAACLVLTAAGSMLYVGTPILACAVVGQVLTGIGSGAMEPVRNTLLQRQCDPAFIGRVTAVMRVGLNSAGVLPLLVAPALADAFGVQPVLLGASTVTALIAFVLLARAGKR